MNTKFLKRTVSLILLAVLFFVTFNVDRVMADTSCTAPSSFSVSDINPNRPKDICTGFGEEAANATQVQAAIFAWKQFVALNWPALENSRGVADPSAKFGGESGQPLVWQTYRNKVEVYPNTTQAPPPFSDPPNYNYGTFNNGTTPVERVQGPCAGSPSLPTTPFINLDEADEIGLNRMYAGVAPTDFAGQQFLFFAKANQTEYDYVNKTTYNGKLLSQLEDQDRGNLATATANYIQQNKDYPTPSAATNPDGTANYVSFPFDTIEIKSGWRQLKDSEVPSFHTAPVRYYNLLPAQELDPQENPQNQYCYIDAPVKATSTTHTWGLGALHIIVKTPTAPYFIFATFDQINNVVDAGGKSVEKASGQYTQMPPATQPFIPGIVPSSSVPSDKNEYLFVEIPSQPNMEQTNPPITSQQFSQQGYQPGTFTGKYLYYENIPTGFPQPGGPIALQKRGTLIPKVIWEVNQQVQQAIEEYNAANFNGSSPSTLWQNYRLVNVQWMPLTKSNPGSPYTGMYPDSYYLANDVVETDYNLQFFSGHFYNVNDTVGFISDFGIDANNKVTQFNNVFHDKSGFNMGGCMGCHGNAAVGGGDSSFIFLDGIVKSPQAGGLADAATGLAKFKRIVKYLK
jgi:hypothetical protein